MLPITLSSTIVAALFTVLTPGTAHAACDWSYYWNVTAHDAKRVAVYRGSSIYNNTQDNITRSVSVSTTRSHSDTHHWEVGADAGIDWKVVSAKISYKYGRSSTTGVSQTVTRTDSMTIRRHYSGWMQANIWNKDYIASKRRIAPYCGDQLVARAVWHDKFLNAEAKTTYGRVDW